MTTAQEYIRHFGRSASEDVKILARILAGNLEWSEERLLEGLEALKRLEVAEGQKDTLVAERNWLANRVSYVMSVPLAGTPHDVLTGWRLGPTVRPSPEDVLKAAKEMVAHNDNGVIIESRFCHEALPVEPTIS